jgi:hypothetical protein
VQFNLYKSKFTILYFDIYKNCTSEVNKVILFGSFIKSSNPNDNFLTLSLKYRKGLRELSKIIPLDIVPIKANANSVFLDEINKGQIVYER